MVALASLGTKQKSLEDAKKGRKGLTIFFPKKDIVIALAWMDQCGKYYKKYSIDSIQKSIGHKTSSVTKKEEAERSKNSNLYNSQDTTKPPISQ